MPSTLVLRSGMAGLPLRFRELLRRELAARCNRNPRYSLRAFANFLDVDHATLSQLLRGKRTLTQPMIRRLGGRIGLELAQIDRYVDAESSAATEGESRERLREVAAEAARALGDSHAFAILELMRLAEFRPDVAWIARMLGTSADAVQVSLQHLLRLGFLEMRPGGQWKDLAGAGVVHEEQFTLVALERVMARSRALLEASQRLAPADPRFHGTTTLAIEPGQAPRLVDSAERVLRDLADRHGDRAKARPGEQLYQVEVSCFPVSSRAARGTTER